MIVTALLTSLLQFLPWVLSDDQQLPFEYFLSPEHQELNRNVPLSFHPDDGLNYRRSYEGKYGRRGERLIALLGGGVAPLSIFDASIFGGNSQLVPSTEEPSTTIAAEPHASGSQEVEVKVEAENNATDTTVSPTAEGSTTSSPALQDSYYGNRKYVEINRRKLSDDFMQNIIPQQESYSMDPEGIIYKRLYGAVWNFGENGLQRRFPPSFLPTSTWPFLPSSTFGVPSLGLPGVTGISENAAAKSESAYAGPGEPSIVVQSYSYRR